MATDFSKFLFCECTGKTSFVHPATFFCKWEGIFPFRPFSPSQILLIFQKNIQFLLRSFSFSKIYISFLEPSYFQNNIYFQFLDPSHFSKMYITSLRYLTKNASPRQKHAIKAKMRVLEEIFILLLGAPL